MPFPSKGQSPAAKSGMRGMGPAPVADPSAPGEAAAPGGDIGSIISQHVHGPDEQGHHHLNLTTLAHHISGGKHPGQG